MSSPAGDTPAAADGKAAVGPNDPSFYADLGCGADDIDDFLEGAISEHGSGRRVGGSSGGGSDDGDNDIDVDVPVMPRFPGEEVGGGGDECAPRYRSNDKGKDGEDDQSTAAAAAAEVVAPAVASQADVVRSFHSGSATQPAAAAPGIGDYPSRHEDASAQSGSQPSTPMHVRSDREGTATVPTSAQSPRSPRTPVRAPPSADRSRQQQQQQPTAAVLAASTPSSQVRTPTTTNKSLTNIFPDSGRSSSHRGSNAGSRSDSGSGSGAGVVRALHSSTPSTPTQATTSAATATTPNSGDFWTDFSAATAPAVEETRNMVRNIFYTTKDRAEGRSGGGGGGSSGGGAVGGMGGGRSGGGSGRKLRRPRSSGNLSSAAAAAAESAAAAAAGGAVAAGARGRKLKRPAGVASSAPAGTASSASAAAASSSAPTSPIGTKGSPSQCAAKLSPKSPGVRRMGRPGKSRKYVSVSLSHEEENGEDQAQDQQQQKEGEGDEVEGRGIEDGGENVVEGEVGKLPATAAREEATADAGATMNEGVATVQQTPDTSNLRGARSASLDSVGDILKNATDGLSPDSVGSQSSPPQRQAAAAAAGAPILGNLSYPDPDEERRIVESFWRLYDDHVILSIFGILGILFRILASSWFRIFDDAFNEGSALFTNLPLNCLSCFIMGALCSGEEAIKILYTRMPGFRKNLGQDKKHDGDHTPHAQAMITPQASDHPTIQHEGEFVFRESDGSVDEYVHRGGRPSGSPPPATVAAVSIGPLRQRRTSPMERIRAGGREMILEVITGGTAEAQDVDPDDELREVQLMALERRIRASKSLVLFPAKKEDIDVMEHYFGGDDGYEDGGNSLVSYESSSISQSASFESIRSTTRGDDLDASSASARRPALPEARTLSRPPAIVTEPRPSANPTNLHTNDRVPTRASTANAASEGEAEGLGLDRMVNNVTESLTRLTQVNIADGWDVGTTPEAMSEDLLLGLRVGFCGCLSTFSSWNSSMINLLWNGHITQAIVGYAIGLQLPIISYRAGQHAAVYWFVWRRRREVKRAERRGGYGLRLRGGDDDDSDDGDDDSFEGDSFHDESDIESNFDGTPTNGMVSGGSGARPNPSPESAHGSPLHTGGHKRRKKRRGGRILLDDTATERTTPSVRAIATAVFLLIFVLLINSLFFLDDTQTSISLLFSPLGVLTRWRLMKYNKLRPGFPLGTFACNMLGCALSGSLGSLLAGNPGPEESMVVQSMIQGFAGSLSSLAAFVVELLSLIDPIIFKYDGLRYAVLTLSWALVVGFITSQAKDWADKI